MELETIQTAGQRLQTNFGIDHTTIQFEYAACGQGSALTAWPASQQ